MACRVRTAGTGVGSADSRDEPGETLAAADRRAVALALPQGITLVEFVHFYVTDFRVAAARGKSGSEPARYRYLAFVISAGEPDDVRMLDLGEAEPIDRMIADFRKTLTGESEHRGGGGKETLGDPANPAGRLDAGARLRSAIFDPVAKAEGLAGVPNGSWPRMATWPDSRLRCTQPWMEN